MIATVQCRVVHGGGRSALATNRQTAAVGNSCQTLKSASNRPLIVRKNQASIVLISNELQAPQQNA